jgi:hypothetical protein
LLRSAATAWFVAGALALTVIGLSFALASANPAPAGASSVPGTASGRAGASTPASVPGGGGGRGLGGFARQAAAVGVVATVGSGSFTVTDRTGQTVTVDEQSSTTYYSGRNSATSSAVVVGARAAVEGTRTGNTVEATTVIVLPDGGFGFGGSALG